jgi:hypothetical protein
MKDDMKSWEATAEKGPTHLVIRVVLALFVLAIVIGVPGYFLGWFSEAGQVAQKEFGPTAALQKYEWFINQANAIKKADQDVKMFEQRAQAVDDHYATYGKDHAKWPPDVRLQYNHEKQQAREDLVAVASNRNTLVQEYNTQSEKFNWSPFQTRPDKPSEKFEDYMVK